MVILLSVCVLALIRRLPSWATTTFGCMRAPSSSCRCRPFTGTRITTTQPWTMTSCCWSWNILSRWPTQLSLSTCPKAARRLGTCASCQDGGTFTVIRVRSAWIKHWDQIYVYWIRSIFKELNLLSHWIFMKCSVNDCKCTSIHNVIKYSLIMTITTNH